MTGQVIAAAATAVATIAAGWFALLAQRAQTRSPETVAGGYSVLMGDYREAMARQQADNAAMRAEIDEMRAEIAVARKRIACMEQRLGWLQQRMPADVLTRFEQAFPPKDTT